MANRNNWNRKEKSSFSVTIVKFFCIVIFRQDMYAWLRSLLALRTISCYVMFWRYIQHSRVLFFVRKLQVWDWPGDGWWRRRWIVMWPQWMLSCQWLVVHRGTTTELSVAVNLDRHTWHCVVHPTSQSDPRHHLTTPLKASLHCNISDPTDQLYSSH